MAYRHGERRQGVLFPASIEDYVPDEAPVRVYDAIIDAADLEDLGFEVDPHKVGCPQYHPLAMLKLLVYGCSYGVRSSRKLERECHNNISFIWLMGDLKPDHKTIAEFRRKNKGALQNVLREVAQVCMALKLIEGNTLFVDGSRFRANASISNSWTKEKCQRKLKKIDKRIAEILEECESTDQREAACGSFVKVKDELADQEVLKARVKSILSDIEHQPRPSVNTTDHDCTKIHSRQGNHAGYNSQIVVDEKHGLIVSCDVVNENTDDHQFADQINQANEVLGAKCDAACGDSGYATVDELEKIDNQNIEVIVPSQRQASGKDPEPFDARNFTYDRKNDCYICPKGNLLRFKKVEVKRRRKIYLGCGSTCRDCEHFGTCTTNRILGRKVTRLLKEDLRRELERQYELPDNQEIYRLRKQKAELPFGHIKHNLGVSGFLLRGLAGVKAEFSIMASCFNITRMIRLLGTERLVEALRAVAIPGNIVGLSTEIAPEKLTYAKTPLRIWRFRKINKKSAQTQIIRAA
jgi:transposase